MPRENAAARNLIGVDVGSTHIKAVLVTPGTGIVHVARRPTLTHAVRGGGAYHRPAEILAAVNSAVAECVKAAGRAKANRPVGIGIASMGEAGVPIDRRGQPIGDMMAWHDTRPLRQAAFLERQIGAGRLFARTGLRPEPKYSLPKLLWLREQRPADFSRLRRWAGVAELVALDMTGELGTNASLACRTLAFDVTARRWDAELLGLASIRPDEMPPVLPFGTAVGGLTVAAGARLGLVPGTPVAIAGQDHMAAALGAGVVRPGDVLDSMGSAEAALIVTSRPALADEVRRSGFSSGCHTLDGLSYVAGGLQSSGALVEWFVNSFLTAGNAASNGAVSDGDEEGRYDAFIDLLQRAGPGPVEPIVLPYLRGRTAPHPDPGAGLEWEGLRETHGLQDIAAALVDGAAFHVRWMLDELARITSLNVDTVKLAGAGARNKRWVAAKAALFPGRLQIVRSDETAALGAALTGGMAAGVYASAEEAIAGASPSDRATAPAAIRARYDAAYLDRWLPAVITRLRQSQLP